MARKRQVLVLDTELTKNNERIFSLILLQRGPRRVISAWTQTLEDSDVALDKLLDEASDWIQSRRVADLVCVTVHDETLEVWLPDLYERLDREYPDWLENADSLTSVFVENFKDWNGPEPESVSSMLRELGMPAGGPGEGLDTIFDASTVLFGLFDLKEDLVYQPSPTTSRNYLEGDWQCSHCDFHNFARRRVCKDCGTSRGGSANDSPAPRSRSSNAKMLPGDWSCQDCGFHNFASREDCKDCGSIRPANQGVGNSGAAGTKMLGDWDCGDCGFHNFARRHNCKNCEAPKPAGSNPQAPMLDGDWICNSCDFHNFASRSNCKDCGEQRPDGEGAGSFRPGSQDANQEFKAGDWDCEQCNFHNFARRRDCKSCGALRPMEDGQRPMEGRSPLPSGDGSRRRSPEFRDRESRDRGSSRHLGATRESFGSGRWADRSVREQAGDWRCEACNFDNFARRTICKNCSTPRP